MPEEAGAAGEGVARAEDEASTADDEAAALNAAYAGDEELPTPEDESPPKPKTVATRAPPDLIRAASRAMLRAWMRSRKQSPDSVEELVESGQYYEAEVVEGVEDAPLADEAEVTTHERPAGENENVPDEEKPGEQR